MKNAKRGFTLLELMISCGVIMVALAGLLSTYVACLELNETTRNTNLALSAAQRVSEEIRSATFTGIAASYNGYNFTVPGIPAGASFGHVYVDNSDPALLNITVGVCWEQRGNRTLGECSKSGGILVFTDSNGNNVLDSPVQLATLVAQR